MKKLSDVDEVVKIDSFVLFSNFGSCLDCLGLRWSIVFYFK